MSDMMMNRLPVGIIAFLSIVISTIACESKEEAPRVVESTVVDPEIAVVQETINGLYASIRIEEGKLPDFEKIYSYFAADAHMGYVSNGKPSLKSPEEYFDGWKNAMLDRKPDLLKEFELEGRTQYFGNIAYHTSLYAAYFNSTDEFADKGIINYQLVKLDDGWKVISMIWQSETDKIRVPDSYFN